MQKLYMNQTFDFSNLHQDEQFSYFSQVIEEG